MRLRRDLVLKNAGLLGSSRPLGPRRSLFRLLARLSGPGNARPIEILFRQTFNRTVNPEKSLTFAAPMWHTLLQPEWLQSPTRTGTPEKYEEN